MAEGKKARPREEELVEAALAAAAAALLVSGVKRLVAPAAALAAPWWWPAPLSLPPPALFLLLNVVIASIVVASVQPRRGRASAPAGGVQEASAAQPGDGPKRVKRRRSRKRTAAEADVADGRCMALVATDGPVETGETVVTEEVAADEEAAGNADEVNKRAEEFISAFRHHLRVDSFSGSRRSNARTAPCF
ncbi:uncharacterized protein LOC120658190 [Panicum virgatum]|uniref:DUF4408 domain-containing protein n=1 Tax=Panicum virgatum TaxID=38727 RepID=A0A8T0VTB3_PANVG|nr:uncharacterized protein LOC120658190 [Panicum virgatum]KAG2636494.1 hypothetical protein PVAP13_2NG453903 [Panicum virgatum]